MKSRDESLGGYSVGKTPSRSNKAILAIDGIALRVVAVTLSCLFVAQALLTNPSVRRVVSFVDRLEGQPIETARRISPEPLPVVPRAWGRLTIRLEGGVSKSAVLLVNGEEVSDFSRGEVTIEVRAGDLIEIDGGTKVQDLVFRVTEASSGMVSPFRGQTVRTRGTIEILSRVRIQ